MKQVCEMMWAFSTAAWKLGLGVLFVGLLSQPVSAGVKAWIPKFPTKEKSERATLGYSMQFWGDVAYCQGWRIQHSAFTKQYRLLDPQNIRQTSGSLEDCKTKLKAKNLPKMEGHAVVLVHGMARSSKSFAKMADALKVDGYTVIAFDYPSTQVKIEQSAEYLHQLLQSLEGVERISFVAHSMGGLVVRSYLQNHRDERIERMVMLAVPNHGANTADILRNNSVFNLILGPAGRQLGCRDEFIKSLPTPEFEFGVIAGSHGTKAGYNPLLIPGDDDGTVSVESSRLAGACDFATVKSLHSVIINDIQTITYTREFLQTGQFREGGEKQPILGAQKGKQ